jgi:23S rRNA (guanosine2251-2'-O)-methyltransferase
MLIRRNTVLEALRGDRRRLYRLWVQRGLDKRFTAAITAEAKSKHLPIQVADKPTLSLMAQDGRHQGVLLEVGPFVYSDVDEMLALAAARDEMPLLLLLDLLHGPQNIGSLLRTAEICGVHGVIMQDRRAPDITPAITQFSAGATEHLLIGQATNLVQTIRFLKREDVWVVGMDTGETDQPLGQIDLNRSLAIVVGHEGSGLRRLVRESCDLVLRLPMRGHVDSLNAAIAGSILLYSAWQARGFAGAR